jgi:hypothetical protein
MDSLITNLINGNLSIARHQAKRFTALKIRAFLMESHGYNFKKAQLTADYLKGKMTFQAYCDSE